MFVVYLFSFQRSAARRGLALQVSLNRVLDYDTLFSRFCQELFSSFFKDFFKASRWSIFFRIFIRWSAARNRWLRLIIIGFSLLMSTGNFHQFIVSGYRSYSCAHTRTYIKKGPRTAPKPKPFINLVEVCFPKPVLIAISIDFQHHFFV